MSAETIGRVRRGWWLGFLVLMMVAPVLGPGPVSAEPTTGVVTDDAPVPSPGRPADPAELTRGAPVNPDPVTLTQPDGATFVAVPRGDGARHWYEDASGAAIASGSDGAWYFAETLDDDGQLVAGDTRADAPGAAPATSADLQPTEDQVPASRLATPGSKAPTLEHSGPAPTIVLLASFTDMAGSTAASYWSGNFFGGNPSVGDLYDDASYGDLDFTPAVETHGTANDGVVGFLNLGYAHPNPQFVGENRTIIRDAINASNPYVNYEAYDTDNDNQIEPQELHVVVILAGFESSYSSSCGDSIWGQRWVTAQYTPTVDTVTVGGNGYMTFGERHCSDLVSDNHPATMGIMAHEMGHDLGWPDLYDIDQSSEGLGEWSLMASGSWNHTVSGFAGNSPALPDPFLKSEQGWLTPSEVTTTTAAIPIATAATTADVRRVLSNPSGVDWGFYNGTGTGQYFLIENRQQTGYDVGLPGCGILVWHIDETVSATSPNADETHKLVDLEEADGLAQLDSPGNRGDAGDPFPGSTNKTTFGPATNPNSLLYSGNPSGLTMGVSGSCAATMNVDITLGSTICPPDDGYEPNDSTGAATTLTPSVHRQGTLCPANSDYFKFTATAGDNIGATLDFTHASGNLELALYNPALALVASSVTTTDDESIAYTAPTTGTYYLRVYGSSGAVKNTYDVVATVGACPPDDGYEPNDTPQQATPVAVNVVIDAVACPNDSDYYSFGVLAGQTITADILFTHAQGDLDATLFNPAGTAVDSGISVDDDEQVSYTAPTAGTYRVVVVGYAGAQNRYSLEVDLDPPSGCGGGHAGVFPDVGNMHPFCVDIEWLVAEGVTGGYPDGTFRPSQSVTRQSMAAFLYRYAGEPAFTPPGSPSFPDVPTNHPFFKEIEWLADSGVTGGFDDGTFRPSQSVTRQSMAAFLYRYAGEPAFTAPSVASFPDVPKSHPFFKEIEWLADTGVTGGFDDGTFRPTQSVTRQAMAAFLHRYDAL